MQDGGFGDDDLREIRGSQQAVLALCSRRVTWAMTSGRGRV